MLIIIHNLPSSITYPKIKSLLEVRCGIQDAILDNLTPDNVGMKVTVGLAEEEDAAILIRKLNGFNMNGCQLFIEDVRKKRKEKKPAVNFNQQLSTNFGSDQINMYQMQQAQMLAQSQMMGQAENVPMMVPAPNYESVLGMYALQQNNMMNYGGQLQQIPAMVPFPSQGALNPFGSNYISGFQPDQPTTSHVWEGNSFKPSDQHSDLDRQGQGFSGYEQQGSWDNQQDRNRSSIRRSRSPHRDSQRQRDLFEKNSNTQQSRWDEAPVNDSYYDPHIEAVEANFEPSQTNALLPRPGSPNYRARDGEPFSHPRMPYESRFGSEGQEERAFPGNSRNIPSPRENRYAHEPNFEQNFTDTSENTWNRSEPFSNRASDAPFYKSDNQNVAFGRKDHAPFGSGSSDRYQNKSRPVPREPFTSNPRDSKPSGFRSGVERNTRPSGPSTFDNKPRASGPRGGFGDSRSSGIRNAFKNPNPGPRSRFDSNVTSGNIPKSPFQSKRIALPNDIQRSSSGPRAPFTNSQKSFPPKLTHHGAIKPSYAEQNKNALQKRPYEKESKFDGPKVKRSKAKLSEKDMNKDSTWRWQATSAIAKKMLLDLQMTELIHKFPFMHKLRSEIKSRIDAILNDRFLVPVTEIQSLYDRTFLRSESQEFFLEVLDKVEKEAEEKAQAYEALQAGNEVENASSTGSASKSETAAAPVLGSKPNPVTKQTSATKPVLAAKPSLASKPNPVSKPNPASKPTPASKPGPSQAQEVFKTPATFSSTLADKKVQKAEKQWVKTEYKTENMYSLEPALQKALDDEWEVIEKLYVEELSQPGGDNEKKICEELLDEALQDLKRAVKLNVTKRLKNITTGLVVRVFAVGKLPRKESVALFLKRYGVLSLKKSDRTKMYVATVNNYENFDTLCSLKDCAIDGISVSFRPMQGVKPSAKEKREMLYKRTANFIKRQMTDDIDDLPKKETNVQTDKSSVTKVAENTDNITTTDNENQSITNKANELSVDGEKDQENSEANLGDLSNDDKFPDEPRGLDDGEFVTIDEAGIDDEGDEFGEADANDDDQYEVADVDCIDDDDLEDY